VIFIKTICELVDETIKLTNNKEIVNNLLIIKNRAGHMEDRLLKYCNAIEDLGFIRVGREYPKQEEVIMKDINELIKEKLEEQHKDLECVHCNPAMSYGNKALIANDDMQVFIANDELHILGHSEESIQINYCPMCGRQIS
jgi:hypothetical protein